MALQAAIIGCGRPWKADGATGFGMSHQHALALKKAGVELAACADINEENLKSFQETHGVGEIFSDYNAMLKSQKFDFVSVCTWPHLHTPMTIAAAQSGARAIHCEKPMATTFGDAKAMVEACDANGTQLTFNHQRRFGVPFQKAKTLLESGIIGDLVRLEAQCGDLFDWGTHWIDMMFFYNNETPAEWVIGQIDLRGSRRIFGAPIEGQGLSQIQFQNGVQGLIMTGKGAPKVASNRLIGSEGVIEVGPTEGSHLRYLSSRENGWQVVDCEGDNLHGQNHIELAIADAVSALENGREPLLSGHNALRATEVIFATYESSRRGARIDLPLDISDSPLQARLEEAGISL